MSQQLSTAAAAICLAMTISGCQTSPPTPDRPAQPGAQGGESSEDESAEIEQGALEDGPKEERPASQKVSETETPEDASAPMPVEASVVIEVTPDVLRVDGDEILSLSDGYVKRNGFGSRRYFYVKGLNEPVDEALLIDRRRRVVYGEGGSLGRVLVKVDPTVPADTIFGLHHTLSRTELEWLTLQVGDHEPVHMQLSEDFIGERRVHWRDRKPAELRPKPEPEPESNRKRRGGVVGGIGIGTVGTKSSSNSKPKTILGTLSSSGSGGTGRGFGGLGLRGAGSGGGGIGIAGLAKKKSSRSNDKPRKTRFREAEHCDASADSPPEPMVLPYATIQLYPKRFSTWLSDSGRRHGSVMFRQVAVDEGYPWWKIYNALVDMRSHFGEADTLLIWPHPSVSSEVLPKIAQVNCKLPERSYASSEAWEAARAEVSECEPLFRTQVMSNGKRR
jgi:hypothetical protein